MNQLNLAADQAMELAVDHLSFTVKNLDESAQWYSKVFGFEIVETGTSDKGIWGILRKQNTMLCLYESPQRRMVESDKIHQIYHFGLKIPNRQLWEDKIKSAQVETFYGSPVRYPHSYSWYVRDPNGYEIEVAVWDNDTITF